MKIAVIAANGQSGQAFVEQALAAGHSVNAGVYGKNCLKSHLSLRISQCDATNTEQLKNLLAGQEAVVSFIGHVNGSEPDVQTVATRKIVVVMKELGIKRLISLTGTGVRVIGDKITLLDRILNLGIAIIDPARVRDGRNHVEVIKASGLDWTVLRVLKLQNVKPKPFKLLENGPTKWCVGRQEVARAVLEVLEERSFIWKTPIIGRRD